MPDGALARADRTGLWPGGPARTVGSLVHSRLDEAAGEFDAIEAEARAVLGLDEREAAGQLLRALTVRWSRAMHKLSGVMVLGGSEPAAGAGAVPAARPGRAAG